MNGRLNCRGVALLTGLIMLSAISLLALVAASGTVLQRNMAINYTEQTMALQNAAIAAAYAKAWLTSRPVSERQAGCQVDCLLPAGIRNPGELPDRPEFESVAWWQSNAFTAGYNPETHEQVLTPDNGAEAARWIIEEIRYQDTGDQRSETTAEGVAYYRIYSRGTGQNSRTVAMTETLVARPWDGDFQPGVYPPAEPVGAFCRQFESRYPCGKLSWRRRR